MAAGLRTVVIVAVLMAIADSANTQSKDPEAEALFPEPTAETPTTPPTAARPRPSTSPVRKPARDTRGMRRALYQAPAGGVQGLQGEVALYARSYAVVIGIDKYANDLPELTGAVRDAAAVAEVLRAQGFQVTLLANERATKDAISEILGDDMRNRVGMQDRVLVFFAGHGVTVGFGEGAMGYLMPVGGRRDKEVSTGISMREMVNWFEAYPAKHVMFVADSCYSGLALNTRAVGLSPASREYLREVTAMPVRLALVAGGKGEQASELGGHGIFTKFFIDGISGAADSNGDGIITSDELAAYVKPNVAQTARSQFSRRQHPQMGRSGEGEFVFLSPRGLRQQAGPAASTPPVEGQKFEELKSGVSDNLWPRAEERDKQSEAEKTKYASADEGPGIGRDWRDPNTGMAFVWIAALNGWVGKYEVTNGEYRKYRPDHNSGEFKGQSLDGERQPVVQVNAFEAEAFADWMNGNTHLPLGYRVQLPNGDTWTTFAQCGDGRKYPWGNDFPPMYGNYWDVSGQKIVGSFNAPAGFYNDGCSVTCPVERSGENDWHLFGVGGNVWEWTTESQEDGRLRQLRGSSWEQQFLESTIRISDPGPAEPATKTEQYGFRLVILRK